MSRFASRTLLLSVGLALGCEPQGLEGYLIELSARVVDENNSPAPDVTVGFATDSGAVIASVISDEEGWIRFPVYGTYNLGHQLHYLASGEGYAAGEGWLEVDLRSPENTLLRADPPHQWAMWDRMLPPIRMIDEDESGGVRLTLVDAETGAPMGDGVIVSLRSGWNAPSSETAVASFSTTGGKGLVEITGTAAGMYTAQIDVGSGYEQTRFPVAVTGAGDGRSTVAISPALARDEMRATVSWSNSPTDLDLHLTGPTKTGLGDDEAWERFHVYSDAPRHPALGPEEDTVVELQVDAAAGYGPESVLVHELINEGTYVVSVYDVAAQYDTDSTSLGRSFAVVQLWVGDVGGAFFEVSAGVEGNAWQAVVYEVEEELWYRVQSYSNAAEPSNVLAF